MDGGGRLGAPHGRAIVQASTPGDPACRRWSAGTRIGSTPRRRADGARPGSRSAPRSSASPGPRLEAELARVRSHHAARLCLGGRTVCLLALDPGAGARARGARSASSRPTASSIVSRPNRTCRDGRRDPADPHPGRPGAAGAREAGRRVRSRAPRALRRHGRDDVRRRPASAWPARRWACRSGSSSSTTGRPAPRSWPTRSCRMRTASSRGRGVPVDPRPVLLDAALRRIPCRGQRHRRATRSR